MKPLGWAWSNKTAVFVRKTDRQAERENHVKTEGRGDSRPQAKETSLANTLILNFRPPEFWEKKLLLFKSPILWYFAMVTWAN